MRVEFPKKREDEYEPFCFRLYPGIGMLVEYTPTVNHTEERRQYRVAKDAVSKPLVQDRRFGTMSLCENWWSVSSVSGGRISQSGQQGTTSVLCPERS